MKRLIGIVTVFFILGTVAFTQTEEEVMPLELPANPEETEETVLIISTFGLSFGGISEVFLMTTDRRVIAVFTDPHSFRVHQMAMNYIIPARPLTHYLLDDIIRKLDLKLEKVVVRVRDIDQELLQGKRELAPDEYFLAVAEIHLTNNEKKIILDAKPVDALILALLEDAPVFIKARIVKIWGFSSPTEMKPPLVEIPSLVRTKEERI